MSDFTTIDGSSGGGQMLRNAVALSAVTGRAVRVVNIRSGRRNPGLQPQHLLAVRTAAEVCRAELAGAELRSTEISFAPGPLVHRPQWHLDVKTAGSITLLLQCLLPALAHAPGPSEVTLIGGTDVPFAPPFDYFREVFLPAARELGQEITARLEVRGFYPQGGGRAEVCVTPAPVVRPLHWLDRGKVTRVRGCACSQRLPAHIAVRMRDSAESLLQTEGYRDHDLTLEIVTKGGVSTGCGIVLWAETDTGRVFAGSSLGERGKLAEWVGEEAAKVLLRELASPGAVDSHLADQLVAWLALAEGPSEFTVTRVTDHLRNAVLVAEAIVGARFAIEDGEPVRVRCWPAGR